METELTALADGLDEGYGKERIRDESIVWTCSFLSLGETVVESFSFILNVSDSL